MQPHPRGRNRLGALRQPLTAAAQLDNARRPSPLQDRLLFRLRPEVLPPEPRSPIQHRALLPVAGRAGRHQIALRAVPTPRAWPHMIHRPRRPAAVGTPPTPAVEDVLPEAQLRRSLRSQVDAINVMVCHAPGAASRLRLPEVDKLTSANLKVDSCVWNPS